MVPGKEDLKDQFDENSAKWQETLSDAVFNGNPSKQGTEADDWDLFQISGPLGSNGGGWYVNSNGEKYYVKFYENPDQGKVEFIANAVYAKLGIKAAQSQIIRLDGREAIASASVPGATRVDRESLKHDDDVLGGFVADAFLANWDVVGLAYDNIVRSDDGLYRIDNGGSLIFRAQGGDKDYLPDSIPELESMREPWLNPAGEIFVDITDDQIKQQALELVEKLTPDDIKDIVNTAGLSEEAATRVLKGLLGRREFLARTYGQNLNPINETVLQVEGSNYVPVTSLHEAMDKLLNDRLERRGGLLLYPKMEILCDRDHIEGQRMDIIYKEDKGVFELRFKLTSTTAEIKSMIQAARRAEHKALFYNDKELNASADAHAVESIMMDSPSGGQYELCNAFVLTKNNVKIYIADPDERQRPFCIPAASRQPKVVMSAMGLVIAKIPVDMPPKNAERILSEVLVNDLGVPHALDGITAESERAYKEARYAWEHAIGGILTKEQKIQAMRLKRKEVFPGYSTFIEEGKYKEYFQKYGDGWCIVHKMSEDSEEAIYQVLKYGLMSTTERYTRGFFQPGASSSMDIDTGGADSVFTRIAKGNAMMEYMLNRDDTVVILKPEILDRTDWYSYDIDNYGSTYCEAFKKRLSPDELFRRIAENGVECLVNEQMFRTGIGPEYIKAIEVDPLYRDETVDSLARMGFETFNGRPINEIILPSRIKENT